MQGVRTVGQELAGPPLGGLLYSLAPWLPFLADAGSYAASALGIATVHDRYRPTPRRRSRPTRWRSAADLVPWGEQHRRRKLVTAGQASAPAGALTVAAIPR